MTDFGTMSVTRSLSISTRNVSTNSGVPHFQSGYSSSSYFAALPIKDRDLPSMTYPGFYGTSSGDYYPSQQNVKVACNGMQTSSAASSLVPGGIACQQQQQQFHKMQPHHPQQQQQQQQQHETRSRGEWITFSKPFLLKLVEKLCQLSFENDSATSSSTPQDCSESTNRGTAGIGVNNHSCLNNTTNTTNTTTTTKNNITSNTISNTTSSNATGNITNSNNNNNNTNNSANNSNSSNCSRKSRLKSRPVKFVRPFESSEERRKSDDSDCGDINVESDNDYSDDKNNSNRNTNSIKSTPDGNPSPSESSNERHKDTLKRVRESGDESDTEHINVEDDDDDDDDSTINDVSMTEHQNFRVHPGKGQGSSGERKNSFQRNRDIMEPPKPIFDHVVGSPAPLFDPIWSEYFKLNYGLHPTFRTAFDPRKGTTAVQSDSNRQSWAAFNKSLVYKMFDEVLDGDNNAATDRVYHQNPSAHALNSARFLFANRANQLNLQLSGGFCAYDVAFCSTGRNHGKGSESERSGKRSAAMVRDRKLKDGFSKGRRQILNRRNKLKAGTSAGLRHVTNKDPVESRDSSAKSTIRDVPILGALLRSNDLKPMSSSHRSSQSINNCDSNDNKNIDQHDGFNSKAIGNRASGPTAPPVSSKSILHHQNQPKADAWPKWVALDKCQVRSLVDSLVATMMGPNEGQSSASSSPSRNDKSSEDEISMQVDGGNHDQPDQSLSDANRVVPEEGKATESPQRGNETVSLDAASVEQSPGASPRIEVTEAESSASLAVAGLDNRDSETETNFSGETQLDQSDAEECSRAVDDMSDGSDDADGCSRGDGRMECHSTHRQCPVKWKSSMLKRMKKES